MIMEIGDRIYWEGYNKYINSSTIKQIVDDSYGDTKFKTYYVIDNMTIEDYNCLKESDPKVKAYKRQVSSYIKKRTSDAYQKILSREPTKEEIDIIDKTIAYMSSLNLAEELEEMFNYFN